MKIIKILALFTIVLSCNTSESPKTYYQAENAEIFDDEFKLKKVETIKFPLDNISNFDNPSVHYFEDGGKKYLSILNHSTRHLNLYDYESKQLLKKIPLFTEGPNSVEDIGIQTGHFAFNKNEYYVLQTWKSIIFKINDKGEVLQKIQLPKNENVFNAYSTSLFPMQVDNNNITISESIFA